MSDHLINTTAKQSRCHRCAAAILTALDEGSTARVDATPLPNRQAEIAALLDNRRTYDHPLYGQLHYRDETRIARNKDRWPIHAEHKCAAKPKQLTLDIGAK